MKQPFFLILPLFLAMASCQDKQPNTVAAPAKATENATEEIANITSSEGGKLHQEKCAGCHITPHNAAFYQRPASKMKSYERLQSQVRLCNSNLNLELFDDDMTSIGEYLNKAYFKFPTQ